MDKGAYLLLGLALLGGWLVIFLRRPDLRRVQLIVSGMGAVAGPLNQYWYLQDYWRPPAIFAVGQYSLEDMLAGFTIAGLAAMAYPYFAHKKIGPVTYKRRWPFFFVMTLLTVILLTTSEEFFHLNTIFMTELIFVAGALFMIVMRRDLLAPSLTGGMTCALFTIPIYIVMFHLLVPGWWDRHWLIADTDIGVMMLPGLPLTEFLWYLTWGFFAGALPWFVSGRDLRR